MPDMLLTADAQRLERVDLDHLARVGLDATRQVGAAVLTNPAGQTAWIVSGFNITVGVANKVVTVHRGNAILATREQGQVLTGILTSEGPATIAPDLASYSPGTYGVYIRFEAVEGGFANRIFWDPAAPGEFPANIPTRRLASWGVAVSALSPGAEWFKIGEVVVSASPPLVLTKQRKFMFEGDEAASPAFSSLWGGGNDRNADRSVHGVKDLATFAQAMIQKVEELQSGTARWWEATVEPLDRKVSRDGDLTLNGNYQFLGAGNTLTVDGTLAVAATGALDSYAPSRFYDTVTGVVNYGPLSQSMDAQFQADVEVLQKITANNVDPLNPDVSDIGSALDRWDALFVRTVDATVPGVAGAPPPIGLFSRGLFSGGLNGFVEVGGPITGQRVKLGFENAVNGGYLESPAGLALLAQTSVLLSATAGDVITNATAVRPQTNGMALGSTTQRWLARLEGATLYGNATPNAAYSASLGTVGLPFNDVYAGQAFITGEINANGAVLEKYTFGAGTAAGTGQLRVNVLETLLRGTTRVETRLAGFSNNDFEVFASPAAPTKPVAAWRQDNTTDSMVWSFRAGNAVAPPVTTSDPILNGDLGPILFKGDSFYLHVQVWDGSAWVNCYIRCYQSGSVP